MVGYILYELHPVEAFACTYDKAGESIITRWKQQRQT